MHIVSDEARASRTNDETNDSKRVERLCDDHLNIAHMEPIHRGGIKFCLFPLSLLTSQAKKPSCKKKSSLGRSSSCHVVLSKPISSKNKGISSQKYTVNIMSFRAKLVAENSCPWT